MKVYLIGMFLLMSFGVIAQNPNCFESAQELKSFAEGYWKVVGDSSNKFYKIQLKQKEGRIEMLENLDFNNGRISNKYDLVFNEPIALIIEKNGDCYEIGQLVSKKYGSIFHTLNFTSKREFTFKDTTYVRTNLKD